MGEEVRKSVGMGELEMVDLGEVDRFRLKHSDDGELLKVSEGDVLLKLSDEGEGLLKDDAWQDSDEEETSS